MRFAIPTAIVAALLIFAPRANAQCAAGTTFQSVTVDQINELPQANVDFLMANAATLTPADLITNVNASTFVGQTVQFTAVALTDPYASGNASVTGGVPNRVHMFVRDVAAATQGNAKMGMQIVDGSGNGQILNVLVGDEIVVCGLVSPFANNGNGSVQMQISPTSITITGNSYGPSESIRQPIVVTTDDLHNIVGTGSQIDWTRFAEFNSQFVRLESATLVQGVPAASGRPDMLFQSAGVSTQVNSGTISLRFRNDRAGVYPNPPYNTRAADNPFTPPATGIVNVQGYLTYAGYDGPFDYSFPANVNWVLNPFADADFVIAVAPPIVTIDPLTGAPVSTASTTISATIAPGTAGNTVASASIEYKVGAASATTVPMTNTSGDTWSGTIPAAANLSFVSYTVTATDNQGASVTTPSRTYRVLDGPINSIALIQTTPTGAQGGSPFYFGSSNNPGPAVPFALNAVVQQIIESGSSFYAILQDDATLQPWTGIWAFMGSTAPTFAVGDRINITEAAVNERFDVTQIQDLVFTVTSSGAPYAYKTVPTSVFSGAGGTGVAEAHEGMMLRFDDVVITNPDAGFGEWRFATAATPTATIGGDDLSNDIPSDFAATNFVAGQTRAFLQGALYYSFGAYKLIPKDATDVGMITTSFESGPRAGSARITSVAPNPGTGRGTVRFELAEAGAARLTLVDVMGREVATLADGTFSADTHDATFDVPDLAAGVYVLRLTAEGVVSTTRVSVVR